MQNEMKRFSIYERQESLEYFVKHGCVIYKDLVPTEQLEDIKDELHQIISQQVRKHVKDQELAAGNGFDRGLIELAKKNDDLRRRLYEIIQTTSSLYRASSSKKFIEIAQHLCQKRPLATCQFRMDLPGDTRFLWPPHQDNKGTMSSNYLFSITALADIQTEKGALRVALGSHKLGSLRPVADPKYRYQTLDPESYKGYTLEPVPMYAGETLIVHTYTIHASGPNDSLETRWQMMVRFEDSTNMPFLDGDDSYKEFNIKG